MPDQDAPPTIRTDGYEVVPLDSVEPHPDNVNEGDVGAIVESLDALGFYGACLVQRSTRRILAGKHRWLAAQAEGMTEIPVLWLDVDDDEAVRVMLGDNRIARLGHDDQARLYERLAALASTPLALTGTGFDTDDLEQIRRDVMGENALDEGTPGDGDRVSVDWENPPITASGQVWVLGRHRVMRGDCRNAADVDRLLDGATVNVAFTSPPYAQQRAYDEDSGFQPVAPDDYVAWFAPVAENVAAHLADDGSWFVNIKPSVDADSGLDTLTYVLDLVLAHAREWGWHWATEFCWERNGVPKHVQRRFKNQYEPIYQFARGPWKIRPDNVAYWSEHAITAYGGGAGADYWDDLRDSTGQGGTAATTPAEVGRACQLGSLSRRPGGDRAVLRLDQHGSQDLPRRRRAHGSDQALSDEFIGPGMAYPGNRLPTFAGSHDATGHSAAFPVGLPAWFIKAFTDEGDAVFDPFVGSGSAVLAAENEQRTGYGMDVSGRYVDVVCRRFHALTGIVPTDAETGEPFPITAD